MLILSLRLSRSIVTMELQLYISGLLGWGRRVLTRAQVIVSWDELAFLTILEISFQGNFWYLSLLEDKKALAPFESTDSACLLDRS
jgi:hypothetical protein